MAKRLEVYKCEVCGNIVEVLTGGEGQLSCCGQPMKLLVENTVDAAKEKHVPVIEKIGEGCKVSVGSVLHPMEEDHYIEWIEILTDAGVHRHYLKPGDKPEVIFNDCAACAGGAIAAREHCNKHGLWKS